MTCNLEKVGKNCPIETVQGLHMSATEKVQRPFHTKTNPNNRTKSIKMLTERFAASLGAPVKKVASTSATKDAGVFIFESQPLSQARAAYKKSYTNQNCLAVSTNHVFAAQADKAVVNVYNREKGNQEATVPFPERIGSIALACEETVLVVGTNEGRLFLWETHTGRLVVTSQAHLQAVTALAVDPTSNFLLSGSADSSIHVWSIPSLLSFSNQNTHEPLHTLSGHRSAITSLATGHSSTSYNIVVSASKDNTAIVWDYHNNTLLRTILLPSTPLCLALDPADRAVYTGYEDGSVQLLSFYSPAFAASATDDVDNTKNPLFDEAQATMPVQPPATTRCSPPSEDMGPALSCTLSYDGSILTTGHESGKVLFWDVPLGRYSSTYSPTSAPLHGPITNLISLPVTGFPLETTPRTKLHAVVKPKHGAFESRDVEGAIPGDYKITGQFTTSFPLPTFSAEQTQSAAQSDFMTALTHPSFPSDLLAKGLAEFSSWTPSKLAPQTPASTTAVAAEAKQDDPSDQGDFMSLDAPAAATQPTLEQKNAQLQTEIAALRKAQRASLKEMDDIKKEKAALLQKVQAADGKKPASRGRAK